MKNLIMALFVLGGFEGTTLAEEEKTSAPSIDESESAKRFRVSINPIFAAVGVYGGEISAVLTPQISVNISPYYIYKAPGPFIDFDTASGWAIIASASYFFDKVYEGFNLEPLLVYFNAYENRVIGNVSGSGLHTESIGVGLIGGWSLLAFDRLSLNFGLGGGYIWDLLDRDRMEGLVPMADLKVGLAF